MINWKVRLKNKNFWLSIIPAILLLIQSVAQVFGYTLDFGQLSGRLLAGVSESERAMGYDEPYKKDVIDE